MIEMKSSLDYFQDKEIISIYISGMKAVAGNSVIQVNPCQYKITTSTLTPDQLTQLNKILDIYENMKASTTGNNKADQTAQLQMIMEMFEEIKRTTP